MGVIQYIIIWGVTIAIFLGYGNISVEKKCLIENGLIISELSNEFYLFNDSTEYVGFYIKDSGAIYLYTPFYHSLLGEVIEHNGDKYVFTSQNSSFRIPKYTVSDSITLQSISRLRNKYNLITDSTIVIPSRFFNWWETSKDVRGPIPILCNPIPYSFYYVTQTFNRCEGYKSHSRTPRTSDDE